METLKKVIKNINKKTVKFSFNKSVPVLLGYFSIGIAFGLLVVKSGYPFYIAPLMSIFIFAGAAQFVAITFFTSNANLVEIVIAIFLLNSRHIFYSLSFLQKYSFSEWYKLYLIFSLTDETYAVLTSKDFPQEINKKQAYFFVSLFDHFYWIFGTLFGSLFGNLIGCNLEGLDFALTALFIVLLIEQIKVVKSKTPFIIAALCSILTIVLFGKENMLLVSIVSSTLILKIIENFSSRKEV